MADDTAGLLFRIRTDNTESVAKIAETKAAIKAIATESGGHAKNLQQDFKHVASEISNLTAIFTGDRLTGATSQITSFSNAVGAIPGPAGLAVGAIAGLAVAAATATTVLFELTKKTAEYGNAIYEASVKTGLSAETISALKVSANEVGLSLTEVTSGIRRFTLLMADAAGGSDKAAAKLQYLHVTSKDLDTGFAQVIKRISELKPGLDQNAAAADAFGKRFGAQLIPLIEHFHGDLPGLIKEMDRLGLTMSNKGAKDAHEFEVGMKQLGAQLSAVERIIGTELMHTFLQMSHDITAWLIANKGEVKAWGTVFADTLSNIVTGLKDAIKFYKDNETVFRTIFAISTAGATEALKYSLNSLSEHHGTTSGTRDQIEGRTSTTPTAGEPGYIDEKAADKAAEEAQKAAEKRAAEREKFRERELTALKAHIKAMLDAEHSGFVADLKESEKHFIAKQIPEIQFQNETGKRYQAYAIQTSKLLRDQLTLDAKGATPGENRNLNEEAGKAAQAIRDEIEKERADREKTIIDSKKKEIAATTALAKKDYENDVALFESSQNKKLAFALRVADEIGISEADQARRTEQIETETLNHKLAALKNYQAQLVEGSDEYNKLENEIKILEDTIEANRDKNAVKEHKRQTTAIEDEKKVRDGKLKSWHDYVEAQMALNDAVDAEKIRAAKEKADNSPFAGLNKSLKELHDRIVSVIGLKNVLAGFGELAVGVFNDMANAVGGAIEQWALYGGSVGQALKKALAAELAHVAGIAIINALYATALGFMRLAEYNFVAAGHAFVSAGLWAALAGGAALGARALSKGAGTTGAALTVASAQTPQNNYGTPFTGFGNGTNGPGNNGLTGTLTRLNQTQAALEETVHKLASRIEGMSPGDVVSMGAGDASSSIRSAYESELSNSGGRATANFHRATGGYR